jgi:hypothetical protein
MVSAGCSTPSRRRSDRGRLSKRSLMESQVLCARHGQAASILACEHVCAAVISCSEPPPYRRLRLKLDQTRDTACCACFACVRQFALADDFRLPRDAKVDGPGFPKVESICTKCLDAAQPPPATDIPANLGASTARGDNASASADSRRRTRVRPTQVSAAVVLLCISLGIDLVPTAIPYGTYRAWASPYGLGGILTYALSACLTYNIWKGRYWARGTYAVLFALGMLPLVVSGEWPGGWRMLCILQLPLQLAALYLLFAGPGAGWFKAETPLP